MKKTTSNLILLNMIFVTGVTVANLLASRLVMLPFGLVVPAGSECFAITFLITDIISEIWGKDEAKRTVMFGLITQLIVVFLIQFGLYMWESIDTTLANNMRAVLASNWKIVVGGTITYIISQFFDVIMFHKVREFIKSKTNNHHKLRWIWNNASTSTSQILDAFVFTFLTFGLLMGDLFKEGGLSLLFNVSISLYIYKLILAILDTPFFLYFTRKK